MTLEAILRDYQEASGRNDVETLASFLDDNFVQTYPTGKVVNKQEHLQELRSMQVAVTSQETTDTRILPHPGFAVALVGTKIVINAGGKEHVMRVRSTQVWREASGWKCVAIQSGFVE